MTVIAWDGKTLSADKQGDAGGLLRTTTKIFRLHDGSLFGSAGLASYGQHMKHWLENKKDPHKFPSFQSTEAYQDVLLVKPDGTVWIYARTPYPFKMEDEFHAIGSGRDYAIAAMHCGKTAAQAVAIAIRYDCMCGTGIDNLELL